MGSRRVDLPGAAHLVLVDGVGYLRPEDAVLQAMVQGWTAQQRSRGLAAATIEGRVRLVGRFVEFVNSYPWQWTPADVEEWTVALVCDPDPIAKSTVRQYQQTLAMFCDYLVDGRYGWGPECVDRFGTHPAQICHEWNTLAHSSAFEGRPGHRALTRQEVQRLFDHADAQVERAAAEGRKGWVAAFRDAALLKTIYAFGLRRREAVMLDVADFTANPAAPELGRFGMCQVRWGKASKGGPPRRRNVCTVLGWAPAVLEEYLQHVRPLYGNDAHPAMWLTERGGRVAVSHVNERFGAYRDALGLPAELGPHCLRHSYVTHLIEDGVDPLFVQQQVGHAWASTTALYTGVSTDFKNRTLRAALDRALAGDDEEQER